MNDKEQRRVRFEKEMRSCQVVIDCINRMITENEGKIKTREKDDERDLDGLVAGLFGKANKTYIAVIELALFGHGEDALVLLRANINLLINIAYILKEDSVRRAGDLIAYSFSEQKKYAAINGEKLPPVFDKLPWAEIKPRASRWQKTNIEERARQAGQKFHYDVGYRFYSSIEHSDAWAAANYIERKAPENIYINNLPSDKFVRIALEHNFTVMANILEQHCIHFGIDFTTYKTHIDRVYKTLHLASHDP